MTILVEADPLAVAALHPALGEDTVVVGDVAAARAVLAEQPHQCVVVVGPYADLAGALDLATSERVARPHVGVVVVRRRVDTAVLKDALRAGVREVVKLDDTVALADACREVVGLAQQVRTDLRIDLDERPAISGRTGQVVTVFSAKGGCGKTTLATNLAAATAKGGRSVCLVDLDLAFGDVAISLHLFPTHTMSDAAALRRLDETAVRALVTRHSDRLDAVLAPVEPGAAEQISAAVVTDLVEVLKRMYDVVVIDTPAALSDHTLAAFDATDEFLLVATLDVPAVKNLKLTLEMLRLLSYPTDRWHIVLNRADSKVGLSVDDVQKMLNLPIAAQIPSSRAVPSSINRGVPIVLDAPGHGVSTAVRRLAERLVPTGPETADGSRSRTRFRRERVGAR